MCLQTEEKYKTQYPHLPSLALLYTLLYLMEATGNKALFLSRGPQYIGLR